MCGMGRPIILHVDLDCFYCQVEKLRLDLKDDIPMAVQQWTNVIAVNYAARAQGVSRHLSVAECLKICPTMVFVHVPTYSLTSPGQINRYEAQGATEKQPVPPGADRAIHKASLSSYRNASLEIFRIFESFADSLEKAGLDEAFLDVTKTIDKMYAELELIDDGMIEEFWGALCWDGLGVPAVPADQVPACSGVIAEMKEDIRLWLGSKIAVQIRTKLRDTLGYTCSIGIAGNKMLAKLGSARNKPFNQTFILPKMIECFMKQIPLQKIRFLGGKLGTLVSGTSSRDREGEDDNEEDNYSEDELDHSNNNNERGEDKKVMASDLWDLSVTELSYRLGGDKDSATWVYNIIRGFDNSVVTPRSKPKSFMAAKSLRPALKEWSQLERWLRLLCMELWERLEEDHQANQRWPRTITLYHKSFNQDAKSHSSEFPIFSPDLFSLDTLVIHLSRVLLATPNPIFPCNRIMISVSKFVPLQKDTKGKRWSTMDRFVRPDVRLDYSKPSALEVSSPSTKETIVKKPKGTLDSFFNKHKSASDDEWACPECSVTFSMWSIEAIQEHQDYHLACRLAT